MSTKAVAAGGNQPNVPQGKIPLADIPRTIWALCKIVAGLLSFSFRRTLKKRPRSFKEDLLRTFIRMSLDLIPKSVLRSPPSFSRLEKSKRYGDVYPNLNERVQRPEFAGNWLCKPRFEKDSLPSEADVVILFLHGGGYTVLHPGHYSMMFLMIAETIVAAGKSVAVFTLDYGHAPEFKFPAQMDQTSACWEYLTTEQNISPSKICLIGDSAGGSLCLSFLTHMAQPLSSIHQPTVREKPGSVFLLSPWVSLFNEASYAAERESDVLDPRTLRRWGKEFVGDANKTEVDTYLEFTAPAIERPSLGEILPAKTFVFAGGDEIFMGNLSIFVDAARSAGVDVHFDVKPDAVHDWQFTEPNDHEKTILSQARGPPDDAMLPGCTTIGKLISKL